MNCVHANQPATLGEFDSVDIARCEVNRQNKDETEICPDPKHGDDYVEFQLVTLQQLT